MKTKVIVPHKKDCNALKIVERGAWKTPWSGVIKKSQFRDKIGRKNSGYSLWHYIPCNVCECPGMLIVNFEEDLPKK